MHSAALTAELFRLHKDPSFLFDPGPHLFTLRGESLWSITGALRQAGIVKTDFYRPEHRIRGQHVHSACHYHDEGDLNWESVKSNPYQIEGYVRAWEAFKRDWNFVPQLIELPMYTDTETCGPFAGIPDRAGSILDGEPAIVEIKSGSLLWWTAYQTAAQDLLLRRWDETFVYRRRFGVALRADGSYAKPVEFTDRVRFQNPEYDYDVFRAAAIAARASKSVDLGDLLLHTA